MCKRECEFERVGVCERECVKKGCVCEIKRVCVCVILCVATGGYV